MIEISKSNDLWTITLSRPDKANALSLQMLEQLEEVASGAGKSPELRALIITGAGSKVFSAGADLSEARSGSNITTNPVWERLSGKLANLECMTIAALNGTLAGGAFGMALACDLRIATPHARFFYPVLKNGFLPQPSDVVRMNRLIGLAKTKLILLAGQKLDADQALSFGLIDRIVQPEDMQDTITDLTNDARGAKREILTGIKNLCA